MKHIIPIAMMALTAIATIVNKSSAQTVTTSYQPGATREGAIYFLPKTAVRVAVLIEKSTYTPGDFAPYAGRFLRLNDVSAEPSTTYRIVGITQTAIGVRDTSKAYAIRFNNKTSAINIAVNSEGVLTAVNALPAEEVALAKFKAAPKPNAVNPRQYMNQDILSAGSMAKMAELTAQEIYDIRDNRSQLVKGQADFMPKDGEQMKLMLNQLDQQDRALTSLFAGTTVRDTTEEVFMIYPDRELANYPLFRFSTHFGLVDADDLSGSPYSVTVQNLTQLPAKDLKEAAKQKKAENGLYYNVPGKMRVSIYHGNTAVTTEDYHAGQFGNVEVLSAELFNKHYGTRVWMNALTGAVDRLEAEQPK